jgi:hypothetical protein
MCWQSLAREQNYVGPTELSFMGIIRYVLCHIYLSNDLSEGAFADFRVPTTSPEDVRTLWWLFI